MRALDEIVDAGGRTRGRRGDIRVDPSLARGLSYYTGAIMEVAVPDLAGSLGGGGRYDNLIGMFLGRDVPACGFSLGLERIIVVMTERGMFPPAVPRGAADVMVAVLDDGSRGDALAAGGRTARARALRVDIYPEASRKLGQAAEVRVEPARCRCWRSSGPTNWPAAKSPLRDLATRAAGQRAARAASCARGQSRHPSRDGKDTE